MFFDAECRRLESLHVMAGRALPFVSPLHELPIVLVPVAVETVLKRQRLLEIAAGVATQTIYRLVFSLQWVLGF